MCRCRVARALPIEGRTMSERNTVLRSMRDIGLAAWFGGSLMGAVGLNGAAAQGPQPGRAPADRLGGLGPAGSCRPRRDRRPPRPPEVAACRCLSFVPSALVH